MRRHSIDEHRRRPCAPGRTHPPLGTGVAVVWLVSLAAVAPASLTGDQPAPIVRCEFMVFAGAEDVTGETRVRVAPTDGSSPAITVQPRVPASLAPGLYDVQAVRVQDDRVVAMRRAERVSVERSPEQGALHVQVINFDPRYGALQIRAAAAGARPPTFEAFAYEPASHDRPVARSIQGTTYALLVVPGGIYDVRIESIPAPDRPRRSDLWLLGVEVSADRSRLKLLPADWGRLPAPREP